MKPLFFASLSAALLTSCFPAKQVDYTVHGFAPSADEFTATVTWTLYAADDVAILQQHTIADVPLQKNYRTLLHGDFFAKAPAFSVSLDNSWSGDKEVTL